MGANPSRGLTSNTTILRCENYERKDKPKVKAFISYGATYLIRKSPVANGGFGRFYASIDTHGREYGIKELRLRQSKSGGGMKAYPTTERPERSVTTLFDAEDEITLMRDAGCLQGPIEAFKNQQGTKLYIVQHLLGGHVLQASEELRKHLTPNVFARYILLEILDAVERVHNAGITHLDIKPDNVLYHEGKLHLTDFGEAFKGTVAKGQRGTMRYRSPEQRKDRLNSPAADAWAAGVTVVELTVGYPFTQWGPDGEPCQMQHYIAWRVDPSKVSCARRQWFEDKRFAALREMNHAVHSLVLSLMAPTSEARPSVAAAFTEARRTCALTAAERRQVEDAWKYVPSRSPLITQELDDLDSEARELALIRQKGN